MSSRIVLLVRSQMNTIDLMETEANLLATRVINRCCGFFYLEGRKGTLEEISKSACATRNPLLLLYEGKNYADLLDKIDNNTNEREEDKDSNDKEEKEENFILEYEQSLRVNELQQIPFQLGVRTACWFVQQVFKRLRSQKATKYSGKTFVIIDYKDFVCLAEEIKVPENHLQEASPATTNYQHQPPTGMFWDRFFRRWSREGKPWSFSSSLDPFCAVAGVNLLVFAYQRLKSGKSLPSSWASTTVITELDTGGSVSNKKGSKKFAVPKISVADANEISKEHGEGEGEGERGEQEEQEEKEEHVELRPHLLDCCCGSGTITAVGSVSEKFSSIVSFDIQKQFLINARNNVNFLFEIQEFQKHGASTDIEFQEMDWTSTKEPCETFRSIFEEKNKDNNDIIVIANTPWGKRCGRGEEHTESVVLGILRKIPSHCTLFGFYVPPKAISVCQKMLNVHLIVPIGKPAVFIIGTRKQ